MHGTVQDPDLRDLDPSRRSLLMLEHDKSVLMFSPGNSPEGLLKAAKRQMRMLSPEGIGLFSLATQSTEREVVFRAVPSPVPAGGTRPPGVAGRFYPADPGELSRMVDEMLTAGERRVEAWSAAMVPHAGLVYSGKLAASVFHRLEIPDRVLILGPKHTRLGVDWAVAPHETWSIPGVTIPSDPALARTGGGHSRLAARRGRA